MIVYQVILSLYYIDVSPILDIFSYIMPMPINKLAQDDSLCVLNNNIKVKMH